MSSVPIEGQYQNVSYDTQPLTDGVQTLDGAYIPIVSSLEPVETIDIDKDTETVRETPKKIELTELTAANVLYMMENTDQNGMAVDTGTEQSGQVWILILLILPFSEHETLSCIRGYMHRVTFNLDTETRSYKHIDLDK